ncbi:DUF6084 family protein [Streptomyces sporangiiformans]|uniref:Uncharacterized protein n=1 Tax=Streptomyces sporangiiformans TaxID=2315329 RepID=A0A505D4A5_9ACTN|nr:DUF6084 family protein [Streptomyces sporangiiformans]TPQ17062.1 hypothetical protein FGD71_038390 [Streptomyces sporangiiformans]
MTAPAAASAPVAPDLAFAVTGVVEERFAALPTLRFRLEVARTGGAPVGSIALTTVVRIDVTRRRYAPEAGRALAELFGAPEQWASSMRPLTWSRTTVHVPAFDERTTVEIPVECSYDMELAITKYLRAVGDDGEVPLDFLFSGTVFHRAPGGRGLAASRISWSDGDTRFTLPAALWHSLTDRYHAGSPWLRLSRETYDRLDDYRAQQVLGSPDDAVRALLDSADLHHPGTS